MCKNIDKQPLVSVIIPNYNHARYLDQRLQSVLGQTYPNFEVIILDDKSTDNSLEVIAKYQNDPHVAQVVINEQNSGNTFKQWDKGISLAKGDVIWIAESDDWCELNMLEELVRAYTKRSKCVLAYCTPELFDTEHTWEFTKEGKDRIYSHRRYLRSYLLNMNWPLNASCCIFNKKKALQVSNRYISINGAGDYYFWVELVSKGGCVAIVNRHLSKWRIHSSNTTGKLMKSGANFIAEKEIFDFVCTKTWISKYRKRQSLLARKSRYNGNYESSEVKKRIDAIWEYDFEMNVIDKVYRKIFKIFRNKFDIFI